MARDYHCQIVHTYKEVNFCVECLANLAHGGSSDLLTLNIPQVALFGFMQNDLQGITSLYCLNNFNRFYALKKKNLKLLLMEFFRL